MFSLRLIYCFRKLLVGIVSSVGIDSEPPKAYLRFQVCRLLLLLPGSCVFQQNLGSCLQLDFGSSLFFLFLLFFFLCYISADTENHAI